MLLVAVSTIAGCGLPRDPDGSLDRVRGGELRAGLIEHSPWATAADGEPGGVEVELIEGFAEAHGARVRWFTGPGERLLGVLEQGELDVVVGGLTDQNPWADRFEFARPYYESRLVVGVPLESPPPCDLDGLEVAVVDGSPEAALVEQEGAVPVRVGSLEGADGPVAAEDWRVRALGLRPTEIELGRRSHMVAVRPGENALREEGHVFFGEALVVPSDHRHLVTNLHAAVEEVRRLDWCLHDLVIMPVEGFREGDRPGEEMPAMDEDGS